MEMSTTPAVTIRETPPIRVAALAHSGDYQRIGGTYDRLTAMAAGQGLLGPDSAPGCRQAARRPPTRLVSRST